MGDAVDKIHELAKGNQEITNRVLQFSENVHQSDQLDKERLYKVIDALAQKNNSAMVEFVSPVGNSVRSLTHARKSPAEFVIDEPVADAIRRGDLEVKDPIQLVAKLGAVDKISRTCKIMADAYPDAMKGKITDPALLQPHNVYTRALDEQSEVIITGKPVYKDGQLHMFYISDARAKEEP